MSDTGVTDVLVATDLEVLQDHRPLLPPTSLTLEPGEVGIAIGDSDAAQEALALALAGRLRLESGSVRLGGDADPGLLRAAVALVDVPNVSAPDPHVPFATIVSEELAMAGRDYGFRAVRDWFEERGLADQRHLAWGLVEPLVAIRTLGEMAISRPGVRHLVLVRPERHGLATSQWMPVATALTGTSDDEHRRGVLVTVSGAVATEAEATCIIGGARREVGPDAEASEPEHAADPGGPHPAHRADQTRSRS
ncbi:hypothetical protein [Nocardioides sp. GXZ039]|uniref:hypothetical protein n=1 Tax=Nocardioides sp. GXZ039 TaxID=3136018 RepID=UPI0030F3EBE7